MTPIERCYDHLAASSDMNAELCALGNDPIVVFYLIMRALDSLARDPEVSNDEKVKRLCDFHNHVGDEELVITCSQPYFKDMLLQFGEVVGAAYNTLDASRQNVIREAVRRTGSGMAQFCSVMEMLTRDQFDSYCQCVAGALAPEISYVLDGVWLGQNTSLGQAAGRLLEQIIIIRDVKEDFAEGRFFWPADVLVIHGLGSPEELLDPSNRESAVLCLNAMVRDAIKQAHAQFMIMQARHTSGQDVVLQNSRSANFVEMTMLNSLLHLEMMYGNGSVFDGLTLLEQDDRNKIYNMTHFPDTTPRASTLMLLQSFRNLKSKCESLRDVATAEMLQDIVVALARSMK